jgi:4-amino-4-deoxy-L-arabinose transferase-like glycosyltransferase
MVVSPTEFIFVIVGSIVISLALLAAVWSWTRSARVLVAIAIGAAVGIIVWNAALDVSNAGALNVDSPFLGLSVQDVGSGVFAFLGTLVVLRLTARAEPTSRVVSAAAIVGLVTIFVDLFG